MGYWALVLLLVARTDAVSSPFVASFCGFPLLLASLLFHCTRCYVTVFQEPIDCGVSPCDQFFHTIHITMALRGNLEHCKHNRRRNSRSVCDIISVAQAAYRNRLDCSMVDR
uniref:Secreted protein n=1 Tax=Anopheles darlingi TaxID=43151 RepID=A0A2M4D5V2_ANODA